MANLLEMLFGKEGGFEQLSTLSPEQQQLWQQLAAAIQGEGAGGAFGESADYFRDILSGDSETQRQLEAPLMRQFEQDIMPGLAEQFAGMGSGGLSSSGFQLAGAQAGTDLSERLGAIRAGLRQQAAQGLQGFGQMGLQPTVENIRMKPTYGLAGEFLGAAGKGAGTGLGFGLQDKFSNLFG